MSEEFGFTGIIVPNLCMDSWGSGPFVISIDGKTFRFGDSDRFGPYLADRHGDPRKNAYPSERSPFWRAHHIWRKQGRRLKDDGITCIWDEPKPNKFVRLDRRNVWLVEAGDEDGAFIEITDEEKRKEVLSMLASEKRGRRKS